MIIKYIIFTGIVLTSVYQPKKEGIQVIDIIYRIMLLDLVHGVSAINT